MNAVEALGLTKAYRMGAATVMALDGVTLSIEEGDFVAVVGRSGSGKSTFLHLVGGLDRPSGGEIRVKGEPLSSKSSDALAAYRRKSVGFVFQSFNLSTTMTSVANVELPLLLDGVGARERRDRAREMLAAVGLAAREGHRPSQMSGGEQQRVAIARALVNRPSLLLADEPTGNLDSRTEREVLDLLAKVNAERRVTIMMVTHDRAMADQYARRVLEFCDGRLLSDIEKPRESSPTREG